MHAGIPVAIEKVGSGDWSDETQKALDDASTQYAQDFGYDRDEEGQPLTDEQAIREGGGRREREESLGDDEEGSGDRGAAVAAGTTP